MLRRPVMGSGIIRSMIGRPISLGFVIPVTVVMSAMAWEKNGYVIVDTRIFLVVYQVCASISVVGVKNWGCGQMYFLNLALQ